MPFAGESFDGIIAYYSLVDTPKRYIGRVFDEFRRVLKPGGFLVTAVKAGTDEGYLGEFLGIEAEIYFTHFSADEMREYHLAAGLIIEVLEQRDPYGFELRADRIFTIARKPAS